MGRLGWVNTGFNGEKKELTPRQQNFVREYLVDFNGAQAAMRAGYSKKCARQIAGQLLGKPHIQHAMANEARKQIEDVGVTPEWVIENLVKIAKADIRDYLSWEGETLLLKDSESLTPEQSYAIESVQTLATRFGASIRFKLHSKVDALEKLGRYLDLFIHKAEITVLTDFEGLSDEELDRRIIDKIGKYHELQRQLEEMGLDVGSFDPN